MLAIQTISLNCDNWEPFGLGLAFAMDEMSGLLFFKMKFPLDRLAAGTLMINPEISLGKQ